MERDKKIISVSRRTDIPAFYPDWLMARIRDGAAGYLNPFGGRKFTVSLRPEDVLFIVFWSKNYKPLIRHLDELDERGFKFCFHFTITGLPRELERGTPSWQSTVEQAHDLARRYSPRHVLWRFDPIVLSSITPAARVCDTFVDIARRIEGATERCYFSYVQYYGKVLRGFERIHAQDGVRFRVDSESRDAVLSSKARTPDAYVFDLTQQERLAFALELAEIANGLGISLHTCCGDYLIRDEAPRIHKAHCVDGDLIAELLGADVSGKLNPTRDECGCWASRDIGAYDTCPHGCMYCYANTNKEKALAEYRRIIDEPASFALGCPAARSEFPPPSGDPDQLLPIAGS
jgi:hypothetical protein